MKRVRTRTLLTIGAVVALALFAHFCVTVLPAPPRGARPGPVAIADRALIVPVAGVATDRLEDTFTQAREHGSRPHDAIDILAPRGTPVVAAAAGTVEKLFVSERGGNTIYVRSPDRRWTDYYAHLDAWRPGLKEGDAVLPGQVLGTVGSTGNADPAAPHLHFAVSRVSADQRWYEGTPVNPYPMLVAGRR